MKRVLNTKKGIAALAVGAIAIVGTSIGAYAYWTSTGTGSGSASTTAGASNLSYSQNTITAMYPGDAAQNLVVTVKNENTTGSQGVGNVKAYITTDKAGCTGADFLLKAAAAPSDLASAVTLTWTATDLAAGATATTGPDAIQFNNTGANQDACKSAAVTIHYVTTA